MAPLTAAILAIIVIAFLGPLEPVMLKQAGIPVLEAFKAEITNGGMRALVSGGALAMVLVVQPLVLGGLFLKVLALTLEAGPLKKALERGEKLGPELVDANRASSDVETSARQVLGLKEPLPPGLTAGEMNVALSKSLEQRERMPLALQFATMAASFRGSNIHIAISFLSIFVFTSTIGVLSEDFYLLMSFLLISTIYLPSFIIYNVFISMYLLISNDAIYDLKFKMSPYNKLYLEQLRVGRIVSYRRVSTGKRIYTLFRAAFWGEVEYYKYGSISEYSGTYYSGKDAAYLNKLLDSYRRKYVSRISDRGFYIWIYELFHRQHFPGKSRSRSEILQEKIVVRWAEKTTKFNIDEKSSILKLSRVKIVFAIMHTIIKYLKCVIKPTVRLFYLYVARILDGYFRATYTREGRENYRLQARLEKSAAEVASLPMLFRLLRAFGERRDGHYSFRSNAAMERRIEKWAWLRKLSVKWPVV